MSHRASGSAVLSGLEGLNLEVAEVLDLAERDGHVLEKGAEAHEAPDGRGPITEPGDDPLDPEPAVEVDHDSASRLPCRQDAVDLGAGHVAQQGRQAHVPSRPPLIVHDPPGDPAPGLEPEGQRPGLVPVKVDRADELPAVVDDGDASGLAGRQPEDADRRGLLGGAELARVEVAEARGPDAIDRPSAGVDNRDIERPARVDLEVVRRRLGGGVEVDLGQGVVIADVAEFRVRLEGLRSCVEPDLDRLGPEPALGIKPGLLQEAPPVAGEFVEVGVVHGSVGVDRSGRRPPGRPIGHAAPDDHASLEPDAEGDQAVPRIGWQKSLVAACTPRRLSESASHTTNCPRGRCSRQASRRAFNSGCRSIRRAVSARCLDCFLLRATMAS
jgi:hypothetical protein